MKIVGFPTLIASLIGAVISYGFYSVLGKSINQEYEITHACISFIMLGSTLISTFGLIHITERTNSLLKVIGLTFFLLLLILFIILAIFNSSIPVLITLSSIFYLIFLLSMYKVYTANQ